jgi:uncharacterized RDD family membrane protein YckC
MSEGSPPDPGQRRMPWEPQTPEGTGADSTPPPPEGGWTPPEPTDPTTVWTPSPPAAPPPWQGAPAGSGGVISSAPVGWSPPPPSAAEIAPGLSFADTTSRAVAYVVDVLFLGLIGLVIGALVNPASVSPVTTDSPADLRSLMETARDPLWAVLSVGIDLAYFVVAWTGGRRATIGQRLFSIQVGNAFDGRSLSLEQAIRRWLGLGSWIGLLAVLPGLVSLSGLIQFLWVLILLITTATSPTKQGLHDRFANTALVRPTGQGTSGLATACLVIVGILVLLAVISFVALIFLGGQVETILSQIGDSI